MSEISATDPISTRTRLLLACEPLLHDPDSEHPHELSVCSTILNDVPATAATQGSEYKRSRLGDELRDRVITRLKDTEPPPDSFWGYFSPSKLRQWRRNQIIKDICKSVIGEMSSDGWPTNEVEFAVTKYNSKGWRNLPPRAASTSTSTPARSEPHRTTSHAASDNETQDSLRGTEACVYEEGGRSDEATSPAVNATEIRYKSEPSSSRQVPLNTDAADSSRSRTAGGSYEWKRRNFVRKVRGMAWGTGRGRQSDERPLLSKRSTSAT